MSRSVALVVSAVVAAAGLSGCGGDSPYCASVKDHEKTLESFGSSRTDRAFASYTKVARAVARTAPTDVKDDWTTIASATAGVLKAHREVGISLQDMDDPAKVAGLSADERATIQAAYDRFNASRADRKAVVTDIRSTCDITLT